MSPAEISLWEVMKMVLMVINAAVSMTAVALILLHHRECVRDLRKKTSENILMKRELDELRDRKGPHCPD